MKILVLSYEYPPIGGGGGVICKNISENLASLGNQVIILTTAFKSIKDSLITDTASDNLPGNNPNENLQIIRINARRKNAFESNPAEMLSWIFSTKQYIKNNPGFVDFDLCMAHFVLPGGEVARWLKRKYGLPFVLVSHGHEIPWVHPRQMLKMHLAAYVWIKKVCRESSLVFVQTQVMKGNLDRFMGKSHAHKHIIIPNGVDTTRFFPDNSKRAQNVRIIFVGRLVLQKDPMTFLKAIKLFSNHTQDFEVHILGDGKMRKKMEGFVMKNGLTDHVKFLGKVPEEKMLEEYQSAHLMIAPSLNEGMSIAALEALSCGVYLIATKASGFEDMITENVNGELTGFSNPEELSQLLIKFYKENKESGFPAGLLQIGINKTFDWRKIALKYQQTFTSF